MPADPSVETRPPADPLDRRGLALNAGTVLVALVSAAMLLLGAGAGP